MSAGPIIMTPIQFYPHQSPYFSPYEYPQHNQDQFKTGMMDYTMLGMANNMPSNRSYSTTPYVKGEDNTASNCNMSSYSHDTGLGISAVCPPRYEEYKDLAQITPEFHTPASVAQFTTPITSHISTPYDDQLTSNWSVYSQLSSSGRPDVNDIRLQASFADMTANVNSMVTTSAPATTNVLQTDNMSSLQEAFQFQPSMSRQQSASSVLERATSNPYNTTRLMQNAYFTQPQMQTGWSTMAHEHYRPVPNPSSVRSIPTMQHHKTNSMNDPSTHQRKHSIQTYPPRRRTPIRSSLPESFMTQTASPKRGRAVSTASIKPSARGRTTSLSQDNDAQLPLPPFLPSMLINTPQLQQLGHSFQQQSNQMYPRHEKSENDHDYPCSDHTCSTDDGHISPPTSDFTKASGPTNVPIQQDPKFAGDMYTPRYKRRNADGRWEGWCGLCRPGRWLDLKNSRYWEDKYRNHGICARTRTKFADPVEIRWVNTNNVQPNSSNSSPATLTGPQRSYPTSESQQNHMTFVDNNSTNLAVMRREGLCGKCHEWVPMDGVRTKARDRAVGWWVHAYECHEKSRKAAVVEDV